MRTVISARSSIFSVSVRFFRGLSPWIKIPLLSGLIIAAVPLLMTILVMALLALMIADDSWGHARLAREMAVSHIVLPTMAETDWDRSRPPLDFVSPDGKWSIHADWLKNSGYDWSLTNNRTSQVFPEGFTQKHRGCFTGPTQLVPLWSSDCRYVALNTTEEIRHVLVLDLSGDIPFHVGNPEAPPFDDSRLLAKNGESIQRVDASAMGWDGHDLKIVIFVHSYSSAGPLDIQAADKLTFRLQQGRYSILSNTPEFHEEFIADL
jgi:hypothetical protein